MKPLISSDVAAYHAPKKDTRAAGTNHGDAMGISRRLQPIGNVISTETTDSTRRDCGFKGGKGPQQPARRLGHSASRLLPSIATFAFPPACCFCILQVRTSRTLDGMREGP